MPNAYQAGSDAPFFLLALLSTGALLRGMDAHNPRFLVLAGLIAGLSLSIRNAGLALLVAQASVLAMTNLMQRRDIRRRFQLALYWGLGTALPVGSLLLWNKVKLGTLSPYTLPPSTLSLAENTGAAMGAYVFDTFPNSTALRLTEHNSAISALLFAILICLLIAWACIRYRRDNPLSNFTLMSAIYAGLGTIMVVMARTRYQWGEPISVRHVAQYDSFLISAVLLWIVQLRRGRATGAAFVCIVFAIVCCRAWDLQARYQSLKHIPPSSALAFFSSLPEAQNLLLYYDRSPQLRALMARTSTDCYIATNLYSLTDSALGLSAHALQDEEFVALDPTYMAALNRLAEKRPSLIVLGQRRLVWNTAGTWRQALQDALPDFRLVSFDRAGLIVLESAHGGCLRAGKNARAAL